MEIDFPFQKKIESKEKGCFGDVGEGSFRENDREFQGRDGSISLPPSLSIFFHACLC